MTSPCTEPARPVEQFRTNPRLLRRRVASGMVVCLAAESVYQDVRVLRLDALAASVIDAAQRGATRADLAAAAGVPANEIDTLVGGLAAARVLERVTS
ncbi:MAG TPA: hypothetical protein VGO03_06435 [Acidimicrobiia bacterium]